MTDPALLRKFEKSSNIPKIIVKLKESLIHMAVVVWLDLSLSPFFEWFRLSHPSLNTIVITHICLSYNLPIYKSFATVVSAAKYFSCKPCKVAKAVPFHQWLQINPLCALIMKKKDYSALQMFLRYWSIIIIFLKHH